MATVDGVTVAKADEIDKKHFVTGNVDVSNNLVLTRENGSSLSVPLPAGGGGGAEPLGYSETWAFNPPRKTSGEPGIIITGHNWTALANPDGGTLAPGVSIGADGKLELEEGWYDITVYVEMGFLVSSVDPEYVRCAFDCGNSINGNTDVWLPVLQYTAGGVQFKRASQIIHLGKIHSDGTAFLRPQLNWGTGVTNDYDNPSVTALGAGITRIA